MRVPAAPSRNYPLICKCSVPAVNAIERGCHGNACEGEVTESPRLDVNVNGDSARFAALPAKAVSAMADGVPPDTER